MNSASGIRPITEVEGLVVDTDRPGMMDLVHTLQRKIETLVPLDSSASDVDAIIADINKTVAAIGPRCDRARPWSDTYLVRDGASVVYRCEHSPSHDLPA